MTEEALDVTINRPKYSYTGLMIPSLHTSTVDNRFIRNTLNIDDIDGTKSRPRTKVLKVPKVEEEGSVKQRAREVHVHTAGRTAAYGSEKTTGVAGALYDSNYSNISKTLPVSLPFSLYSVDTSAKQTHEVRPSSAQMPPSRLNEDRRLHGCGLGNKNEHVTAEKCAVVPRQGRKNLNVGWRGEHTAALLNCGLFQEDRSNEQSTTYQPSDSSAAVLNADVVDMLQHPERYKAAGAKLSSLPSRQKGMGLLMKWHDKKMIDDHVQTLKSQNQQQEDHNTIDKLHTPTATASSTTTTTTPTYYTKTKLYQQHRVGPGSQRQHPITYPTDSLCRNYGTLGESTITNCAITDKTHAPKIYITPKNNLETSAQQRSCASIAKYKQDVLLRSTQAAELSKTIRSKPTHFTLNKVSTKKTQLLKPTVSDSSRQDYKALVASLPSY